MQFTIRKARESDAGAIIALLNPIILAGNATSMDETLSLAEQIEFMRGFPARGVFHVATSADEREILGLQDVAPLGKAVFRHVGEISTFVAMSAQRLGVGRALMQATCQAARAQGFRKLSATVRGDNPKALAYYQSQGFNLVGVAREQAFLHGRYIDEVLLEKFIN